MKINPALLFLLLLLIWPVSGQPAAKPFAVRANIDVLDTDYKRVGPITKDDIRLFEDGVRKDITYFAERTRPLDLVLVMDNTGSVRDQLDELIRIGKVFVDNLREGDRIKVIRFVGRDKIETTQDWTSDKAKLNDAIENLYSEGGQSAVVDAVYKAVSAIPKADHASAVVVITDAEDRDSYHNFAQLAEIVRTSDTQVFPLVLAKELQKVSTPNAERWARTIAAQSGGTLLWVDKKMSAEQLSAALKDFIVDLRAQYVVGYESDLVGAQTRKLSIEVTNGPGDQKRRGFIRDTLVLPKP
ncbi:MAG: VWA domain-containing protein [Acidobacteria bacterium]|nr:VWA domain-containing protein [Acidobacteriota bacterium]